MCRDWDEGRSLLFGRFGETFVELGEVMIFQETVGLFFGFDSVKSEFVRKPALEGGVHPFTSASGLGRVGWDHPDSQLI